MKILNVPSLPTFIPPKHNEVFIREICGPNTGCDKVAIGYAVMLANGGAEMHVHEASDHVFYVLAGELKVTNGQETHIVSAGQSLLIPAGEPHSVTGAGRIDCQYLNITTPPPVRK